jgi:hypothetical protein
MATAKAEAAPEHAVRKALGAFAVASVLAAAVFIFWFGYQGPVVPRRYSWQKLTLLDTKINASAIVDRNCFHGTGADIDWLTQRVHLTRSYLPPELVGQLSAAELAMIENPPTTKAVACR